MLRTLFLEYPGDLTCWLIEDEYLFSTEILVVPLMEDISSREVYLPPGLWTDYQDGSTYEGAIWHCIYTGEIPVVMLIRNGAVIPHVRLAQSIVEMDWRGRHILCSVTSCGQASAWSSTGLAGSRSSWRWRWFSS